MNSPCTSAEFTGTLERIAAAVQPDRLLDTAFKLIAIPSRTGECGEVSDALADMLRSEGFTVERPLGGWKPAPAVAVRYESGRPGRVCQFNGHLDTVHLPFVPPEVNGDRLTGSGSSDMKAGTAAAIEALRVVRDLDLLPGGGVLFTAHDLHEAPWGDGSQLANLIAEGWKGDGVLIPEYTHATLPISGRGNAHLKIKIRRPGAPLHEVYRPVDEPDVIRIGAQLIAQFHEWQAKLSELTHPIAGAESIFVGQIHAGEIYNQYPQECAIEGTRRWLPGHAVEDVKADFLDRLARLQKETGAEISAEFMLIRDAFELDVESDLVRTFQGVMKSITGSELPTGPKPFADDGSTFWQIGGVPAVTHGPMASGAHTLNEWVSIPDLSRVAKVYAATASAFCGG